MKKLKHLRRRSMSLGYSYIVFASRDNIFEVEIASLENILCFVNRK